MPSFETYPKYFSHILLVDPTKEEEDLTSGEVTVVTSDDQICMMKKTGECASLLVFYSCVNVVFQSIIFSSFTFFETQFVLS